MRFPFMPMHNTNALKVEMVVLMSSVLKFLVLIYGHRILGF